MSARAGVDKDWPLDRVMAEQEQHWTQGTNVPSRLQPLSVWLGMHTLDEEREHFEAGDKMALFAALRVCATHDLAMPEWVAKAFIEGYDAVLNYRARSWDEAFGDPYPKGLHLGKARRRRRLRHAIYARVQEIKRDEPDAPIDASLWERIAEEFGIGATKAEEWYYEVKRGMGRLLPR